MRFILINYISGQIQEKTVKIFQFLDEYTHKIGGTNDIICLIFPDFPILKGLLNIIS